MEKVIPVAYSELLCSLKAMFENSLLHLQIYKFHSLWPLASELEQKNPWEKCVTSLYDSLILQELFYSESTSKWLSFHESKFLDPEIFGQPGPLSCVLDVARHLNLPLVDLPSSYRSHLSLTSERLTEKNIVELYFANLTRLKAIKTSRNEVILFMLKAYAIQYSNYEFQSDFVRLLKGKLSSYACIPIAPDGKILRKCSEIVNPKVPLAGLFDEVDNRFPLRMLTESLPMMALQYAGMMHSSLNWDLVIERARSVESLIKRDEHEVKALKRVELLLSIIVYADGPKSGTTIDSISFLPVMKKPKDYPLSWYGDSHRLLPGKQLVWCDLCTYEQGDKFERIAGSQVAFLCENLPENGGCGLVSEPKTRQLLQLRTSPSLHEVIAHLKAVITQFKSSSPPKLNWITKTCEEIYHFIDQSTSTEKSLEEELKNIACIWNGEKFLDIDSVAKNWTLANGPYLYTAPPALSSKERLSSALGVKDKFTYQDALKTLQRMKSDYENRPIDKSCEALLNELISIFHLVSPDELKEIADSGSVYLPDMKNILHTSSDLLYIDVDWIPVEGIGAQVSETFPRELAISLGVRPVRSKILEQYVSKNVHFSPFGQREELTRRIQNIIRDYPSDVTVLKELLQNADDARAKKMYVILDKRTHGKNSVLSPGWEELQGPALLVWNDKTFSEKDLKGIQEIGLGRKRSDAKSIGQYGIGFNVVYHLTDCPSFITNGDTLCVLDPHCKYVPEAREKLPGGRYDLKKFNGDFWKTFADMSSAYLQDGASGLPEEFLGGSLFRFPIRHTEEMLHSSEIIDHQDDKLRKPYSAEDLSNDLGKWMPQIKQAMFFLNHVTELKYIEIDQENGLHTKFHFKTEIKNSATISRPLEDAISAFTETRNCKSCAIQYPLTLTEVTEGEKQKETWLIQQGIGDLNNNGQYWRYVKRVKPRHGIAAPLLPPKTFGVKETGQLFCFLPLPEKSGVPTHINGCFMLDSNRRGLWKSTNPSGDNDDRSQWNNNLFKAIASSYANFLVQARKHFLKSTYSNWKLALNDWHNYYQLFPHFPVSHSLPYEIYKNLVQLNAEVLCVPVSKKGAVSIEWHPLTSQTPSDQVYFWSGSDREIIHPVLELIGMKVTFAPPEKMNCLNKVMYKLSKNEKKIVTRNLSSIAIEEELAVESESVEVDKGRNLKVLAISPHSVFEYYTKHSQFSSSRGMESCAIKDTAFKDVKTFLLFIKYLMKMTLQPDLEKASTPKSFIGARQSTGSEATTGNPTTRTFPDSPFSHFLLLTADGILGTFHVDCKILNSRYSSLFPNHLDMFLHPDLQVVNFDKTYFISPEDKKSDSEASLCLESHSETDLCQEDEESDSKTNLHVSRILNIFKGTLPDELYADKVVHHASAVISVDKLSKYWNCFREDEVFACYLPEILNCWALLLTTDDRLFSTANEVLPSYPPVPDPDEIEPDPLFKHICAIMKALQMPFLNITVVSAEVDCPRLSDHDKILSNFCHTNEKVPLTSVIKDTSHIDTLIGYFAMAAKPRDSEWVRQVSSLPFFTDVLGNYLPITNKVTCIWPSLACGVSYSRWVVEFNALFLQARACWVSLGSPEQLKIRNISAEQLYIQYIFPKFHLFTETERYKHLEYIRCFLYFSNKNYKENEITEDTSQEESQKISDATTFIKSLKNLKCIGPNHSRLKPISAFCDHNIEVFRIFSRVFQTLPKKLQSKEWLEFFKELDLKQMLTQPEYLMLCNKTAGRDVKDVNKCSDILLQYIFSPKIRKLKLWSEGKYFLSQVSDIAFVRTCDTSSVNWIVSGKYQANQLVKLNGAASRTLMTLMWTHKPIIHLPPDIQLLCFHPDAQIMSMLSNLGFSARAYSVNVHDIETNLQNICRESSYADENLFNHYPGHLYGPENSDSTSLLKVMQDNLKYLVEFQTSMIAGLPCIPVYCDPSNKDERQMVLVKPSSVVCSTDEYHPYLHCIPQELRCLMHFLTEIGVKQNFEMHHMQIVLEKIFKHSEGATLDPNAKKYVKKAVEFLHSCLVSSTNPLPALLSPLYLPNTADELKLSTTMLYCDTWSYFGEVELDLTGTPYSHFDITEDSYGVSALDICRLLPEEVRPLGMSVICKQVPDEDCDSVDHSDLSHSVEESFQDENNPVAFVKAYNKFIPNKTSDVDLEHLVATFFSSITICTKCDLQAQIVLRESSKEIGHTKSSFFLELYESPRVLYIDHNFDDEEDIFTEIVEHLCNDISQNYPADISSYVKMKFIPLIAKYLRATPVKKREIFKRYRIEMKIKPNTKFKLEIGEVIPEYYHNRLDQDPHIDNIFRPMEYVGYEDKENHNVMVVAGVLHLVKSGDGSQFTKTYHITTGKENKDVSILYLYKFITGLASEDHLAMVPYTKDGEVTNLYEGDLMEIKESIRKELSEIWKLNQEFRKKAVQRLYLKWHPDKNLENIEIAQEVFVFLKEEIDRLRTLEEEGGFASSRGFNYPMWDHTAHSHREAYDDERVRIREDPSYNPPPFGQVNEYELRPEEGKRWVDQAKKDYSVLCCIHSRADDTKGYGYVCFMAHQVVEKALKGGVYALCGRTSLIDHDLTQQAYALWTVMPDLTEELTQHTFPLESYYLNTRYPNRWPGCTDTPSDHYSSAKANEAKDHAETVLKFIMTQIFHNDY